MSKRSVVELVTDILQPFLDKQGLELYDIEFIKEDGERYLRVYVDKEPAIGLDDCEKVSKFLSDELDRQDPIKEKYYLEVSSPGAERLLRKPSDYQKYQGHKVEVQLMRPLEGLNRYTGKLISKDDASLKLELRPKKYITIPVELIDYVKNILEI
ncbi:MAG TPA: ribosome maturation factor RimP [Tissierellia bacterium]|nr:ribosome maturation factor RimP [Tissierellia bacterium]